jgi:uncharacterized protein (DUF58 family)
VPTRRGWAVVGAAIGCLIGARTAPARELNVIAVAAAFIPIAAVLAVRMGSYRIGIVRRLSSNRVFPGGSFGVELDVHNVGHMPTPPLLIEDHAPPSLGGPARLTLSSLGSGSRTTVKASRTAGTRGRYSIGPVRLRLVDPFGLAERTTDLAVHDPVVVFPPVEQLHGEGPPAERAGAGPAAVFRLAPEGDEFYAVREYISGDDLRKIHWASVARTGELMIRQEEAMFFPRATLFLDTRRKVHRGSGADASVEWAIGAVASVAWHLAREGYALRLGTDELSLTTPRSGREAANPLLEALAVIQPSPVSSLVPGLRRLARRPGADGALFCVLPPPTDEEIRVLGRLRTVYAWCGVVLLDADSFTTTQPRARAVADQRLAAAEGALTNAGWRVATAGSHERFKDIWQTLTTGSASRPSSSPARW